MGRRAQENQDGRSFALESRLEKKLVALNKYPLRIFPLRRFNHSIYLFLTDKYLNNSLETNAELSLL